MNDINQLLDEASQVVAEAQVAVYALDQVTPRCLVHQVQTAATWGLLSAVYIGIMLSPLWLVIAVF